MAEASHESTVSPYGDLSGRTVLVTGSSRNLGREIAKSFGAVGCNVGVTGQSDEAACEETVSAIERLGGRGVYQTGDLSKPDDVEAIVDTVRDEFGDITVLVNNAAIRPTKRFLDIEREDIAEVFDVNFTGPFQLTQRVVSQMLDAEGGSIVNVLGLMAIQGRKNKSHVVATKTAQIGLIRSLASEFGPRGIRANGVVPGRKILNTDHDRTQEGWEENIQRIVDATPLRRRGEPHEIANLCRFLASEQASFVTGQIVHADGGLFPVYDLQERTY